MIWNPVIDRWEKSRHARGFYAVGRQLETIRPKAICVLGATATQGRDDSDQAIRAYHAVELDADRLGVLFAALAGYRAAAAVPVLMTLIERSGPDAFHPSPKKRAEGFQRKFTADPSA